ncbi:MAG TPA: hypothetical protein PLR25_04125, partial [Planctomycetaceae bacterium]|nr:hypothetical protein [Planctomycetaceae bacterium]
MTIVANFELGRQHIESHSIAFQRKDAKAQRGQLNSTAILFASLRLCVSVFIHGSPRQVTSMVASRSKSGQFCSIQA